MAVTAAVTIVGRHTGAATGAYMNPTRDAMGFRSGFLGSSHRRLLILFPILWPDDLGLADCEAYIEFSCMAAPLVN
jgi:hypothetical protein